MENSNSPTHPTPEEERSVTPETTVALGVSSNSPPSQAQGDESEVIYNGDADSNNVTVAAITPLEDDAESNTSEKKLCNGENPPKQSSSLTSMSGVNKRNKQLSSRTMATSKNFPLMGYQILPIIPQPVLFPVMPKNQYGYQPSLQASQDPDPLSTTNLYIKGLPENCTDNDLEEMCKQYGKIVSTKAILDKKTGICKGYGFVDFQDPADANKAVDNLQINGVQAQFAKLQEQDPTNLYMSNLPKNFTEKHLEQLLTPFGSIISSRILRDLGGSSRGVGFVRLDSHENCQLAIQKLAATTFPGCNGEPLNIKFADGSTSKRKIQGNWKDMDIMGWKDYGVQDHYVYDVPPPVLAPNSYVGSRLMSHNIMPGSPYMQHQSSQVAAGYQVPTPGTTQVSSSSWANQYYLPPGAGNMNAGDHNIHSISSQLNSLQMSSQNGSNSARPGSGNNGHTPNPIPPTHTAQYTQQPPGWTIRLSHPPPPHYIQQHT